MMLFEAKQLLDNGFDWVVRTEADMNEITDNSASNIDENAEVELIDSMVSLIPVDNWIECIMNKGEIITFLSEQIPFIKWGKHSLKDWSLKQKKEYKLQILKNERRKGYKVFKNPLNSMPIPKSARPQEEEDYPF